MREWGEGVRLKAAAFGRGGWLCRSGSRDLVLRTAGDNKALLLQRTCWEMTSAAGCCLSLRAWWALVFLLKESPLGRTGISVLFGDPCGMGLVYSNLEDPTADMGF